MTRRQREAVGSKFLTAATNLRAALYLPLVGGAAAAPLLFASAVARHPDDSTFAQGSWCGIPGWALCIALGVVSAAIPGFLLAVSRGVCGGRAWAMKTGLFVSALLMVASLCGAGKCAYSAAHSNGDLDKLGLFIASGVQCVTQLSIWVVVFYECRTCRRWLVRLIPDHAVNLRSLFIPDDLPTDFLLPLVRWHRRYVLAIYKEGIIFGRARRRWQPPEHFQGLAPADEKDLRLRRFAIDQIIGVTLTERESSPLSKLEVQTESLSVRVLAPLRSATLAYVVLEQLLKPGIFVRRMKPSWSRKRLRGIGTVIPILPLLFLLVPGAAENWETIVAAAIGLALVFIPLVIVGWRPVSQLDLTAFNLERNFRPAFSKTRIRPRLGLLLRVFGVVWFFGGYLPPVNGFIENLMPAFLTPTSKGSALVGVDALLFTIPGLWMILRGYRYSQHIASEVLKSDRRRPVLFLRSFGDDDRYTFSEESMLAAVCGLVRPSEMRFTGLRRYIGLTKWDFRQGLMVLRLPLRAAMVALGRGSDTAEEQLQRALSWFGPVVAVGNPEEALATPGAARLYVGYDQWQSRVQDLMQQAALVIVQPSDTEGIWWELEQALERCPPRQLLICLKSLDLPDVRDVVLARLGRLLGTSVAAEMHSADFIYFSGQNIPHPLRVQIANPFGWPLLGTSAALRRTLAPIVGQREAPAPQLNQRGVTERRRLARVTAAIVFGLIIPVCFLMGQIFLSAAWVVHERTRSQPPQEATVYQDTTESSNPPQPAVPAPVQDANPPLSPIKPDELRSINADIPTKIIFVNGTGQPIRICWVDYQGNKQFYARLLPGQQYTQPTYVTHPWIATDDAGTVLGSYIPANGDTQTVVFK